MDADSFIDDVLIIIGGNVQFKSVRTTITNQHV